MQDFKESRHQKARLSEDDLQPPSSPTAERGILACLLLDPRLLPEVQDKAPPDLFYDLRHQTILQAICDTVAKRGNLETAALTLAVIDLLKRRKELESSGGLPYVSSLPDDFLPSQLPGFLQEALECLSLRRVIDLCLRTAQAAKARPEDPSAFLEGFERESLSVGSLLATSAGDSSLRIAMQEHQTALENNWKGQTGLRTGWPELDDMLGGLDPSEVLVVGAAPSVGKTALICNVLANLCTKGIPCGFFSLEMTRDQIAGRLASALSGIPLKRAKREMHPEDFQAYQAACMAIMKWPLRIASDPSMTIARIRARARRMISEFKVALIGVDYLQLIEPGIKTNSRNDAVGHVSKELKAMARELRVPVIVLSQLSRDHLKANRKPTKYDLRESGDIEAAADKILMLHPVPNSDLVKCYIEKNRNEECGMIELEFEKPKFRFKTVGE